MHINKYYLLMSRGLVSAFILIGLSGCKNAILSKAATASGTPTTNANSPTPTNPTTPTTTPTTPTATNTSAPSGNALTTNYVSPAAQAAAAAGIVYPAHAHWGSNFTAAPRGATPSDNASPAVSAIPGITSCTQLPAGDYAPCVEQWHAGSNHANVVWQGLISGGNCSELFLPGTAPVSGQVSYNGASYPWASTTLPNGVQEPIFSDPLLQAMANSGCGPFGHVNHMDLFRMWQPGDTFKVYPAVYPGVLQLQTQPDYYTGGPVPMFEPNNITIQGITINGIRPALLRTDWGGTDSETPKTILEINSTRGNITVDNLDLGVVAGGYIRMAVVFDTGGGSQNYDASGNPLATPTFGGIVTLSHLRIYGGQLSSNTGGANGIMGGNSGGVGSGGTLQLIDNEIYQNGGIGVQNSSGIGHNVYLPEGIDPNFTVIAKGNWSHDAYIGHEFKSRAQNNIIEGNYFEGGLPQGGGYTQSDSYNVDIPNAGTVIFKNNILYKTVSTYGTNGIMFAYGMEGCVDNRALSVDIENNTFVQGAATFDGLHPIVPMNFGYPSVVPANGAVTVNGCAANIPVTAINNLFVGVNANSGWLGTIGETISYSELNPDYTTTNKKTSSVGTVGLPGYKHSANVGSRTLLTVGAQD